MIVALETTEGVLGGTLVSSCKSMNSNKTIQVKYETEEDKKIELALGEKYTYCYKGIKVVNQGYLSTYDFKLFSKRNGKFIGWLEVKKKEGMFWDTEIIPITKWNFAKQSEQICLFLVERDCYARLFNITSLIARDLGQEREIKRREDQPEGSRKVVFIPTEEGKIIYYI